jgi:hypothetical protein
MLVRRLLTQYSHHSSRSGSNRRRVNPEKPWVGKVISSKLAAPPKSGSHREVPGNSYHSSLPASGLASRRPTASQVPNKKSKSPIVRSVLP